MNRRYIISFALAKLLKEFGCNCVTNFYYRCDGNPEIGIEVHNDILMEGNIASPCYYELEDWLEKTYNVYIDTSYHYNFEQKKMYYYCTIHFPNISKYPELENSYQIKPGSDHGDFYLEEFDNREDALEKAFRIVLKYIKEQNQ